MLTAILPSIDLSFSAFIRNICKYEFSILLQLHIRLDDVSVFNYFLCCTTLINTDLVKWELMSIFSKTFTTEYCDTEVKYYDDCRDHRMFRKQRVCEGGWCVHERSSWEIDCEVIISERLHRQVQGWPGSVVILVSQFRVHCRAQWVRPLWRGYLQSRCWPRVLAHLWCVSTGVCWWPGWSAPW